jgi:hypothetical protein
LSTDHPAVLENNTLHFAFASSISARHCILSARAAFMFSCTTAAELAAAKAEGKLQTTKGLTMMLQCK